MKRVPPCLQLINQKTLLLIPCYHKTQKRGRRQLRNHHNPSKKWRGFNLPHPSTSQLLLAQKGTVTKMSLFLCPHLHFLSPFPHKKHLKRVNKNLIVYLNMYVFLFTILFFIFSFRYFQRIPSKKKIWGHCWRVQALLRVGSIVQ